MRVHEYQAIFVLIHMHNLLRNFFTSLTGLPIARSMGSVRFLLKNYTSRGDTQSLWTDDRYASSSMGKCSPQSFC